MFVTVPGMVDAWLSLADRFRGNNDGITVQVAVWEIYALVFPIVGLLILLGGVWWTRPNLSDSKSKLAKQEFEATDEQLTATSVLGKYQRGNFHLTNAQATERGSWTPNFCFQETGDLQVITSEQGGHYWCLGKEWQIEGWLTVFVSYSTAAGYPLIRGLPFVPAYGSGQYSIECEALDGSFQVAKTGQLGESLSGIIIPCDDELKTDQSYRLHVLANFSEH
ncbi:MAG: hypothetical protein O2909_05090 [Chloroflexi bacterium]|nr:hypothetical protein [Chloroflexota bacterium]